MNKIDVEEVEDVAKEKSDKVEALNKDIANFFDDPYGHVLYSYPWGEEGTSLAEFSGPDTWQIEILNHIAECVKSDKPVRIAVSSGHGIGKTALIAWIVRWLMDTRVNPSIVVTANTKVQLDTKTWRELAKWHDLAITKHLYVWTATAYYRLTAQASTSSTWRASAIPWSIQRAQAFAGTHERDVLVMYDEASEIPKIIWDTSMGAMTTKGAMMIVFGNPTMNSGAFRECFYGKKKRWHTKKIDARDAKMVTNREEINEWEEDEGYDSDFFRIRVRGEFPRAGSTQFIRNDIVTQAMATDMEKSVYTFQQRVLGVDVARFGEDKSAICVRQGRKVHKLDAFNGLDTMQLTDIVVANIKFWKPVAVFVDGIGIGSGVVDRLNQLGYRYITHDVNVGRNAADQRKYVNKRAEIWGRTRDWLEAGADIPNNQELEKQLTEIRYSYHTVTGQLMIEKKKEMKLRSLPSPDEADAICLTFTEEINEEGFDEEEEENYKAQGASSLTGY